MKNTNDNFETIQKLRERQQAGTKKVQQLDAQIRQLEKRLKAEERKRRTNRLCQIGGTVEAVLGRPMRAEEIPALMNFLKGQEERGHYFSDYLKVHAKAEAGSCDAGEK